MDEKKQYLEREPVEKLLTSVGLSERLAKVLLDTCIASDVAPVVHGEWQLEEATRFTRSCSCCGMPAPFDVDFVERTSEYCPYCGAKMDGKRLTDRG